ncbi:hypothetical protein HDV03_002133 [Kappamyces sp. JEL0829]|nr:hypothetical protein HDV03_002133 [Kappamyces sp. JEL0829]
MILGLTHPTAIRLQGGPVSRFLSGKRLFSTATSTAGIVRHTTVSPDASQERPTSILLISSDSRPRPWHRLQQNLAAMGFGTTAIQIPSGYHIHDQLSTIRKFAIGGPPPVFICKDMHAQLIQIYLESHPCTGLVLVDPWQRVAQSSPLSSWQELLSLGMPKIENFDDSQIPLLTVASGLASAAVQSAAQEIHNRLGGDLELAPVVDPAGPPHDPDAACEWSSDLVQDWIDVRY